MATHAVSHILRQKQEVYYCPQRVAEFSNVATRPLDVNGLGLSDKEAWREIDTFEEILTFLPETPEIYPEWKRFVRYYKVRGLKVFDAHLVAVANVNRVGSILTFNVADFTRYSNLTAIHPASLAA